METVEPKPKKPTRQQRNLLNTIRDSKVSRFVRERWTSRGSTATFYWAPDDTPGIELSEKVIQTLFRLGWVESTLPDRKPTSLRDMVKWQTEATLHLTDAGKAVL